MSLTPGTRLGPYEILALLGAGGMGEVYRARDTKLHRDVAIKVLPSLVANDPERLARFEREAQVLASLNHPHIAALYGLEESNNLKALVMELVDGPTLADRIGPSLAVADAVSIARQIAEALEAAHEKGIVHRDLKPANVKLTSEGQVKVLDFGLAKALDPTLSNASSTDSPTLTTPAMTQMGMVLGTAAYMAPEQARGALVDKRADIWAFGVVFFELLAGKRLFEGQTVSDTLAAVLRQDIDWRALPAATPPGITRLLQRCLERDPKRRLRDIGEARIALDGSPADSAAPVGMDVGPSVPARTRERSSLLDVVAAALIIILGTALVLLWLSKRPRVDDAVRVSVALPAGTSFIAGGHTVLAVSRDGSKLAIVGSTQGVGELYLRPFSEFDPRPVPGTNDASSPFFSPDGLWVGFFGDGKLKKTPAGGGPIITLADATDNRGAVWTDDDTIVYSPQPTGPLQRIPAAGGTPQTVVPVDEQKHERTHRWPSLLPDGKTILFTVGSDAHPDDYDDASIEAVRLDTGARHLVVKGGRMAQYVKTGHLLYLHGRILYAVAFDPAKLELHGVAVPVVDGVAGDTTTGAGDYGVAENGTLAYVPGDPSGGQRRLAWVGTTGAATPIDVPPALYCDPKVSPDGHLIVVSIIGNSSARDIAVIDPVRGTSRKLTFSGMNRTPLWSRDGRKIYYLSYEAAGNVSVVMSKAADGAGEAERLHEIPGQVYLEDLSPDGSTVVLSATGASTTPSAGGLRVLAATGKTVVERLSVARGAPEPTVIVSGAADAYGSAISVDGRWLAYASVESGRPEIYVQSFVSNGGRAQASTNGGLEPHWSSDGRTLYYLQGNQLVAVGLEAGPSFVAGRPRVLFGGFVPISLDSAETYHVSPTGDRFVMMRPADEHAAASEVKTILNWFADLTRTVSPGGKR